MFSTNMLTPPNSNADQGQISASTTANLLAAAFNGQLQQQQQEALTTLFRSLSSLASNKNAFQPSTSAAPSTSSSFTSSIQSVVAAAVMQQQLNSATLNHRIQVTDPNQLAHQPIPLIQPPTQAYQPTTAPLDLAQHPSNQDTSQSTSGQQMFNEQHLQQRINYCTICNKELCNKYFMKTHMLKMHGINLEIEQSGDKSDAEQSSPVVNELAGNSMGGVVCDICNKELCSKYFLKVHKQNTHGIVTDYQDANQFVYPFGKPLSLPNPFMPPMSVSSIDMNTGPYCFGAMGPFGPAGMSPTMIVEMILKNQNQFSRTHLQNFQNPKKTSKIGKDKGNIDLKQKSSSSKSTKDKNNSRYLTQYTEGCPMCDRRFKSIKWLKTHMMNDHKQEIGAYMQMMMQQFYSVKNQPLTSIGRSPTTSQSTCFPFNLSLCNQQQQQQPQQILHQQDDDEVDCGIWPASCLPASSTAQFNIATLSGEFFGKETEGAPLTRNLNRSHDLEGAPSGSSSLTQPSHLD